MATTTGVFPCYENQFKVKVDSSYVPIADCETFEVAFDNNVEEWTPFESEGWVRRLMTGKGVTITVSAKRNTEDAGNNYIAGLAFENGRSAEVDFQWEFPDQVTTQGHGTTVEFTGAPINVTALGSGDSTAVAPLEFEILSNGKPTVTPAS